MKDLAKITSLYVPNCLVNGDFKINTRGKSSYSQNKWTLPMWYFAAYGGTNTGALTIAAKGIKIMTTGANWVSINQRLSDYYRGKTVTLAIKVNSLSGTGNIQVNESSTIGGINKVHGMTNLNSNSIIKLKVDIPSSAEYDVLAVCVQTTGTCFIEYVAMWEGDIVYNHKPEDEETALVRTKKWLKVFRFQPWSYIPFNLCNSNAGFIDLIDGIDMGADKPTVTISGHTGGNLALFHYGGTINTIGVPSEGSKSVNCIWVTLDKEITDTHTMSGTCFGVGNNEVVITISCEGLA